MANPTTNTSSNITTDIESSNVAYRIRDAAKKAYLDMGSGLDQYPRGKDIIHRWHPGKPSGQLEKALKARDSIMQRDLEWQKDFKNGPNFKKLLQQDEKGAKACYEGQKAQFSETQRALKQLHQQELDLLHKEFFNADGTHRTFVGSDGTALDADAVKQLYEQREKILKQAHSQELAALDAIYQKRIKNLKHIYNNAQEYLLAMMAEKRQDDGSVNSSDKLHNVKDIYFDMDRWGPDFDNEIYNKYKNYEGPMILRVEDQAAWSFSSGKKVRVTTAEFKKDKNGDLTGTVSIPRNFKPREKGAVLEQFMRQCLLNGQQSFDLGSIAANPDYGFEIAKNLASYTLALAKEQGKEIRINCHGLPMKGLNDPKLAKAIRKDQEKFREYNGLNKTQGKSLEFGLEYFKTPGAATSSMSGDKPDDPSTTTVKPSKGGSGRLRMTPEGSSSKSPKRPDLEVGPGADAPDSGPEPDDEPDFGASRGPGPGGSRGGGG